LKDREADIHSFIVLLVNFFLREERKKYREADSFIHSFMVNNRLFFLREREKKDVQEI